MQNVFVRLESLTYRNVGQESLTCEAMDWLTITILLFGAAAGTPAVLLTMQTVEFRRYVRSRIVHPKPLEHQPAVALFAPCKGLEAGLKDNLRPLFQQDHSDYRLVLIVESTEDPACEPIGQLMLEYPQIRSQLIVAGKAKTSGQKVHNLLVATADLDDVEILAFVDSDARPKRSWLRQLVQHLNHPLRGAATGYRWYVPTRNTLPNLILHSINASIAALVGPGRHHMVWGGAWAIRRPVFEQIDLRSKWEGTLSDDLVAARELASGKKKLDFEPACMTASPVDLSWSQMLEFVRRQYTVARFYTPKWWLLGLVFCTISQIVFWGGLIATAVGIIQRAPWTWMPLAASVFLYVTYVARATMRQSASKIFLPGYEERLSIAMQFDVWLSPIAAFFNWVGLMGSLFGNSITWRGITYSIARGGKIGIVGRTDTNHSNTSSQPSTTHSYRRAG
jgi:ceramide glucosyltransferase